MLSRASSSRAALLAAAVAFSADPSQAQGQPRAEGSAGRRAAGPVLSREITPQLRGAVFRGLEYLKGIQRPSGLFLDEDEADYPVAVTALAGLAFLAGGHTDKEGPYTETMRRAIAGLLKFQDDRGFFNDNESRMYGHGFATLFLAELYGMTGQKHDEVRLALKKAVQLIEVSQTRDGGWDYLPGFRLFGSRGQDESDTSITVCQTMALRAARNLGIHVDTAVVERARAFMRRAQNSDGGFRYRIVSQAGILRRALEPSAFPRSAAGVCILYSLARPEEYDSAEMRNGFDYLLGHYRGIYQFRYYAHYYATQAMFQAGGKYWAEYFPYLRDKLVGEQGADGSWSAGAMEVKPQATAMALICLQVPYRLLPILER